MLKLHQVKTTQLVLETSEEWRFQAKNNLVEAHGLYTTLQSLSEENLPSTPTIDEMLRIELTNSELNGENRCIKLPIDLVLLAISARGEFNPYINAIFTLQMQKAGLRVKAFPWAAIYADIGLRLHSKLSEHILTQERYDSYLHDFVWSSDDQAFTRLDELAEDLWHLRMAVHPSRTMAERLLVGLLGHTHEVVRDRAIMGLCSYYDSTDWELKEPFVPVITTVGRDLVVHCTIEENLEGLNVIFMIHAPVARKNSPRYVLSYHRPDIKRTEKGTMLAVDLGTFLKCGFYDWRFAVFRDSGLEPVTVSVKGSDQSSVYRILQGRFIVHPGDVRDLQIHEIFIDLQDAAYDLDTDDLKRRGNFETVRKSLKPRYQSGVNCLYLMGALERDNGMQGENPKASPFAVTCRQSPCKMLGGDKDFRGLMREAKTVGMRILVDCLARVSSTHYHRRYKGQEFYVMNENGRLEVCYGTDGRAIRFDDTVLLNYRKASVWNLLVDDILSFAQKYKIDGIHLDNAHAWPQIMVRNDTEMYRKDPDGQYHFNTQEIFDGKVVLRNEFFGYWQSSARYKYANPLFFRLCKELWKYFPDFIIVADVWSGSGLEDRVPCIPRSGPIPRLYQLPVKLASIFGKRLHKNGQIESIDRRDVSILKTWYEERKRTLPEGAIVIQSSSGHSLPYPALLYGKGTWAAADVLLLLPDIPMTFIGEQDGQVYRTAITQVYTQQANLDAEPIMRAGSSLHLQGETQVTPTNIPQVESAASLSVLSTYSDVLRKQNDFIQAIGPDAGFDLMKIKAHYHHRRSLRHEKAVLRYGDLVPLIVKHEHGWHKQVLAFARTLKDEIAIVVINFNDHPIKGNLDMKNLAQNLSADIAIFSLGIWSEPDTDEHWFREELIQGLHEIELAPYSTQIYGLYPSDTDTVATLRRSVERMKVQIDQGKSTDSYYLSLKLVELLQSPQALKTFPALANHLATIQQYLLMGQSVPVLNYTSSIFKLTSDSLLTARLFACAAFICKSRGPANDTKVLCAELLKYMRIGPIVFTCPELGRWSTVGGLGVMVYELALGLAELGEEVWCISPYYEKNSKGETGYLERDPAGIRWTRNIQVKVGGEQVQLGLYMGKENGINLIFLQNGQYFPQCYLSAKGSFIIRQLAVWGKATLECLCSLPLIPAVVATNDWFAGLVAAYAKTGAFGSTFSNTTFLHIVHNLDPSYEGRIYPERNEGTFENIHGLPYDLLVDPFWTQKVVNPSRCALRASDQWATVSKSYRDELLKGSALKAILKEKTQPFAFPNGIPIKQRLERLSGTHETAKEVLQRKYLNNNVNPSIPLFGFVGRITEQKGVQMILDAAESLIPQTNYNVQFLIGGKATSTDPYSMKCASAMRSLQSRYPGNFYANPDIFFSDGPTVNLGCDFGLMPSLFEPGGIVQHEFFVAGTPVVAYKTGGLKDSVIEFNQGTMEGSGFSFDRYRLEDFIAAIHRAIGVFRGQNGYQELRKLAFTATMDGAKVSRAWNSEFYRLRRRLFHEPEEFSRYLQEISASGWTSNQTEVALPETKRAAPRLKRTPSGILATARPSASTKRHTLFRYTPSHSQKIRSIHLVGSFDKWQNRHALLFDSATGSWQVTLQLGKGQFLYKFVIDGHLWVLAADAQTVPDEHGNLNNLIVVS